MASPTPSTHMSPQANKPPIPASSPPEDPQQPYEISRKAQFGVARTYSYPAPPPSPLQPREPPKDAIKKWRRDFCVPEQLFTVSRTPGASRLERLPREVISLIYEFLTEPFDAACLARTSLFMLHIWGSLDLPVPRFPRFFNPCAVIPASVNRAFIAMGFYISHSVQDDSSPEYPPYDAPRNYRTCPHCNNPTVPMTHQSWTSVGQSWLLHEMKQGIVTYELASQLWQYVVTAWRTGYLNMCPGCWTVRRGRACALRALVLAEPWKRLRLGYEEMGGRSGRLASLNRVRALRRRGWLVDGDQGEVQMTE